MTDYIYGYDLREFQRLEQQHRTWLPHVREHWQAGNIRRGDVVLDIGCGPGFVSTELAHRGISVLACDQDQSSLDALDTRCREHGIKDVRSYPACDVLNLPEFEMKPTVAYMRWLLCYLGRSKTEALFRRLALDTGDRLLVHDFINYRSARLEPFSDAVQYVVETCFQRITDADIGFALPALLERCGFEVTWKRVVAMAIAPSDPEWSWPDQFFRLHVPSLENADAFFRDWNHAAENPGTLFYSWPVLQIVAVKK